MHRFKKKQVSLLAGLLFVLSGAMALPTQAADSAPADKQTMPYASKQMQERMKRFMQSMNQLHPGWMNHPELMALHWVGLPAPAQRQIATTFAPLENPQQAQVIITQGGLLDDAVAGSKTVFSFRKQGMSWMLFNVQESWRCQRTGNTEIYQLKPCP